MHGKIENELTLFFDERRFPYVLSTSEETMGMLATRYTSNDLLERQTNARDNDYESILILNTQLG